MQQQQQSRSTPRGRFEGELGRGNYQSNRASNNQAQSSNFSNSSSSSYNNTSSSRSSNASQPNRRNQKDEFDAVDLSLMTQGYLKALAVQGAGDNQRGPLLPLPYTPSLLPLQGQPNPNISGGSGRSDQQTQQKLYYSPNNNYNVTEPPPHRVLKQSVYDTYSSPVACLTESSPSQNSQAQNRDTELQSRSFPCRPPVQQRLNQVSQQNLPESQSERSNMSVSTKMSPDELLQNFRSLECSGCQRHFGYQSRTKKDLIFCAASCIDDHTGCNSAIAPPVLPKQQAPVPTFPPTSLLDLPEIGGRPGPIQQTGGYGTISSEIMNIKMGGSVERRDAENARSGHQLQYSSRHQQNRDSGSDYGGGRASFNSNRGSNDRSNRDNHGDGYNNRGPSEREQNGYGNNGPRGGQGYGNRNSSGGDQRGNRGSGGNRGYGDRSAGGGGTSGYGRNASSSSNPFTKYGDDDDEWAENTDVVDRKVKTADEVSGGMGSAQGSRNTESSNLKTSMSSSKPTVSSAKPTEAPTKGAFTTHQKTATGPVDTQKGIPAPAKSVAPIKVAPVSLLSNLGSTLKWSELELGVSSLVNRSYINDVGDYYVQGLDVHKLAMNMMLEVSNVVKSGTCVKLSKFEPLTLCLAPFCGEYYRGELIGPINSDDRVSVFFSDYGNVEDVMKNDIMELPSEFASYPRLISHCQWDLVLAKEFPELKLRTIFSDERLAMTPKYKIAEGQYIIQLGEYTCNATFEIVSFDKNAEVIQNVKSVTLPKILQTPPVTLPTAPQTPVKLEPPKLTPTPASTPVTQPVPVVVESPTPAPIVQTTPVKASPVIQSAPVQASPVVQTTLVKASPVIQSAPVKASPVVQTVPVKESPVPTVAVSRFAGTRPRVMKVQAVAASPKVPTRKKYMLKDLTHSSSMKSEAEVFIIFVWSSTRYLIGNDVEDVEGARLQSILQTNSKSCDLLNGDTPVVGEVLLGPYSNGEIFRGVVKTVDTTTKTVLLEFVDYGDSGNCKFEDLRIPSTDMMKIPLIGLTVNLPELAITFDGEESTLGVTDYLAEKFQFQSLDDEAGIHEEMEAVLWITSSLTLNSVAHKKPIASG